MNQRPSRNLIGELAKREKELAQKDVAVLLVHTSNVEPAKLKEWLDNRNIPFACGNIEIDAEKVLFAWGIQAQPWLILTDEEGVVRAEGFGLEQFDEKLQEKDSNLSIEEEKSRENLTAISAAPSGVDKSIVQVDLSVVEVSPGSKMDRETIIEIENLLGSKITIPDSPAAADLLRKAAGATAAVEGQSAGDKRVTQQQFNTLFDMLVSRGFVKILMRPTLVVVDGQTAKIKTDQNSLEVTANAVKDDIIYLTVKADLSSQSIPEVKGQKPIISTRSFASFVRVSSGQSQIIGGMIQPSARPDTDGDVKVLQAPARELMCIVTASIIASATNAKEPMETLNFQNVEVQTVIEKLAEWTGKTIIPTDELMKQKITIYTPQKMPRSEAAAMILNSLRSKGYTVEQTGETIFLKPITEEQLGINKTKILIDTKILTVSDEFLKYIGLDPNSAANSKGWLEYLVHSSGDSASFVIDQLHTDLILKAVAVRMRTDEDIQMLHKPQVLAASGKKLEIHILKPDYYMLRAPTEPNALSGESESKSNRIELGATVRLTPTLTPDGKNVELDFEWEYRRLRGIKEHTGPDGNVQKIPQVAVDSIKTPCTIPDGKTLLITGKKITEQKKKKTRKFGLADLPLIGRLFYSPPQVEETKNLLILVKPIINPPKKAPPEPLLTNPNDPLIKQLEEKFKRSDEQK